MESCNYTPLLKAIRWILDISSSFIFEKYVGFVDDVGFQNKMIHGFVIIKESMGIAEVLGN